MKYSLLILTIIALFGCSAPQAPQPPTGTTIPGLSIPDTIDFGLVRLGESKDTSILLKNNGSDTIKIMSQHFSDSLFKLSNAADTNLTIAPGASKIVGIRFSPSDTLAIVSFDTIRAASKATIVVLRAGAFPFSPVGLRVSDTVDFGDVRAGLWKTLSVTFQDTGKDTIHITSQIISDSAFQEDAYWKHFYIAPDSSRIINITYFPRDSMDVAFDTVRSGASTKIITLMGREVPFSFTGFSSAPKEITISLTNVIGRSYGAPYTFSFYYDEPGNPAGYHDSDFSFYGSNSGQTIDYRGDATEWWSNITDVAATIDTNLMIRLLSVEYDYSYNTRGGYGDFTKREVLQLHDISLTKTGNSFTAIASGPSLRSLIDTIYIKGNFASYTPHCNDNLPMMDSLIGFTDSAKLSIVVK